MRRMNGPKVRLGLGVALVMLILGTSSLSVQGSSSIAQGFAADDPNIVAGALVSLKSGSADTVELATAKNIDRLLGVAGKDSLIELSGGTDMVQIVTSGGASTLVSDINGAVKTGDKITASPIAGVGMKALASTLVIGTAQANLDSVSPESRTISDKSGNQQIVHIGLVSLQVDKAFYQAPQDSNSFLPPVLENFAASIAGHPVSPIRVMVSAFLVLMLFVVVGVLLYAAVRSSIISIGRNPLSEVAVRKSLLQVGLIILGILVFTVVVVYLVLVT